MIDQGPISLFATGIANSVGGIASANRNVAAALEHLAGETNRPMYAYVFHEDGDRGPAYRAFRGRKGRFALTTWRRTAASSLAVFDHVRLALPILALPRRLRPRVVICAHGSESWKRIKPSSIRAFQTADLTLTNSTYTLAKMRSRFSGFSGAACPLGLSPQFALTAAPPCRSDERLTLEAANGERAALGARVMLLVGRMDAEEREKGHRELIAVMPQVVAEAPDAQLVFVGGGSDEAALRALAAQSPVAGRICFTGRVGDDLLARLYAKAYAFTMPSRQEGFGLVYLEAMNYALPCIACRDDGGADVVVDGETGLLVDQPVDPAELAHSVISLLADESRAKRMGEAGWRRLRAEFSAEAHQARILEFLRPLAS